MTVRFSTDDSSINLASIGGGIWSGTWRPVRRADAAGIEITAYSVDGSIRRGGQAILTGDGAGHSAVPPGDGRRCRTGGQFRAGIPLAPAVSSRFTGVTSRTRQEPREPAPTERTQPVQVLLGDRSLPLYMRAPDRSTFRFRTVCPSIPSIRSQCAGERIVSARDPLGGGRHSREFSPKPKGHGQAIILKSDQLTLARPGTPASVGETVVIYCTGLGAVDPPVADGAAAPSSVLAERVNPVTLRIGGKEAR